MAEPIAIIGRSCRLPGGANSPSKLWQLLANPKDCLRKIDRFNADGYYHKDGAHPGHSNVRHAYLLEDDIRAFDPQFFGIRPVEAESIDPLQRFLLETVYEALEDAGLPLESLYGSDTGFYAGVMQSDYADILLRDLDTIPQYFSTASSRSILANRVSYVFDWHGPSLVIDTACSSSAVALHSAFRALRSGECKIAVAAGANLILGPEFFIGLSKMNLLSVKGRSAMWDESGNGYGRGEGVVGIVLKRLSDAIRDGDDIDCVIREIGHNHDGRTRGITMPSAEAQANLIRQTYADAGLNVLDPKDQPQFFEAHGTGTRAGDPQEAEAIFSSFLGADAFQAAHLFTSSTPLWVGGIKTVVGHTEATAGLAGLLKTSLALQAGMIPPNMHFHTLNPEIEKFYGPLQIPTKLTHWPELAQNSPRRASVNSFGFGGSNVHAILEAYTPKSPLTGSSASTSLIPFVFSAHSETSLARYLCQFKEHLKSDPQLSLFDLAWTLSNRRSALPVKTFFHAASSTELASRIETHLESLKKDPSLSPGIRSADRGQEILAVFTGQGAQWARMGFDLITSVPTCQKAIAEFDAALQSLPETLRPDWCLLDELSRDATSSVIHKAKFSQTLCTVVQVILVDLLRASGVSFSAVVGHSSGEIGAAYAAEFLSATDAIKIAYLRGLFAPLAKGAKGEKGAMLAVGLSSEDAENLCNHPELQGRLKVAAINSSSSITLSGDEQAVIRAQSILDERQTLNRLLKVDTAYHSHHMDSCAKLYAQALADAGINFKEPANGAVWFSSVTHGHRMQARESIRGAYWVDNMVNTVHFYHAVRAAVASCGPFQLVLEIGPHPALKGPATQNLADHGTEPPYLGVLNRNSDDLMSFSTALGSVWATLGSSAVDFSTVCKLPCPEIKPTVLKGLPGYAWDHDKPYWYESRRSRQMRRRPAPSHPLLGLRDDENNKVEYRWRNFLTLRNNPWLDNHQIQGQTLFPVSAYVSMAMEAARVITAFNTIHVVEVEGLVVDRAVSVDDEDSKIEMITTVSGVAEAGHSKNITADMVVSAYLGDESAALTKVAQCKIIITLEQTHSGAALPPRTRKPAHLIGVDTASFYLSLENVGYDYGEEFRRISSMEDVSTSPLG